ncbi:MAG: hypothetical protein RR338_04940 [Clostridia bacterium]
MRIAIKFDKQGNYVSHCTDLTITDLKQVVPSNDGFAFYETDLDVADINYFKLVNDKIVLDEQRKASDLEKIAKMRLEQDLQQKISPLKTELQATDYKAIKFAEGQLSASDYEPIKQVRQALRDKINKLECGSI